MLFILLGVPIPIVISQEKPEIAPSQKSDSYAEDENGHKFRVQHGELAPTNFQIAGVDLAREGEILDQAARILGPVTTRATGDASTGDERACYRPTDKTDKTRLYFHRGEVSPWFVLSLGTPASETLDVCRPSSRVTKDIATSSGLHLGQTEERVIAILGLPTRSSHSAKTGRDLIVYEYQTQKKNSPSYLAWARKTDPGKSEQYYLNDYGFYSLWESIKATFANQALTELEVDWSATE